MQEANEDASSQDSEDNDGTTNRQQSNDTQSSISLEKSVLVQQRFEEGYDLPDDEYMKWLHETHPELIMNRTAYATENYTPVHANDNAQITHEKLLLFQQWFEE